MHGTHEHAPCCAHRVAAPGVRERGVRLVMALAFVTMLVEIVVGHVTNSMALSADGWHMATHVGALALASVAYVVARRYAAHPAFGFGTGKVSALAGFASALLLGAVAVSMLVESVRRLAASEPVDFSASLPVAVAGLIVNLASIALIHGGEADHHAHDDHDHDHNHRAVALHLVADALTSALAIGALVVGYTTGIVWLDPVCGIIGGVVILQWVVGLCRISACELLDVDPAGAVQQRVRERLETIDDVRVVDLHVWSLGAGRRGCVATVVAGEPRDPDHYRAEVLALGSIAHVTVEVRRCDGPHARPQRAA